MSGVSTIATTAASITLTTGMELVLQPGTNQVLTDIKGWHNSPGVRRNSTPRLWAHGNFSERGWRDARLISVQGFIFCDNRADAAAMTDTLNAALADGAEGTFTVLDSDLGNRWAKVYMIGTPTVDWDGNEHIYFAIDMEAPDPRKYGLLATAGTPVAAPGGGLAWDLFSTAAATGVLDFGAAGAAGTVTFSNPGTADTAPALKVSGYAPGFTITNVATGARLTYTGTVLAGQYVLLNASDGSVLLNGYADRSGALARREWSMIPGNGSATFLFESVGADANAALTLEAYPAWW